MTLPGPRPWTHATLTPELVIFSAAAHYKGGTPVPPFFYKGSMRLNLTGIIVVALAQLGIILAFILFTQWALRYCSDLDPMIQQQLTPSRVLIFAKHFRYYLLLLPIIWISIASALFHRDLPTWHGICLISASGILLLIGLILLLVNEIIMPFGSL